MGSFNDISANGALIVGVVTGILSTSLQAVGLTLQRQSHILEDEKEDLDKRRPPYRRRRWQVGMLLFLLANVVGSSIQITTLPLPVLSALQASGLVFNTIFASIMLSEPFTRNSVIGTALVCAGAFLIATFGAINEPAHDLDELLRLFARRPFMIWIGVTLLLVVVTLVGMRIMKVLMSKPSDAYKRYFYLSQLEAHGHEHELDPHERTREAYHSSGFKLVRGMLYGMISGILSAHTLLLAKSAAELLVRSLLLGSNQFKNWGSWFLLFSMVALALIQLYFLHCGLKLCSTVVLYPFVFCVYNVIAILDGLIYFSKSAAKLTVLDGILIALGTVVLLTGVLLLSWRSEGDGSGHGYVATEDAEDGQLSVDSSTAPDTVKTSSDELQPLLVSKARRTSAALHGRPKGYGSSHGVSPSEASAIWTELDDGDTGGPRAGPKGRCQALRQSLPAFEALRKGPPADRI